MSDSVRLVWDESLVAYDFGPSHPMAPVRVELTVMLMRELGLLEAPNLTVVPAPFPADDDLLRVHDAAYVEAVRRCGADGRPDLTHGLGTEDDPVFIGMHEASAHVLGATVEATRSVWSRQSQHALNVSGGLHHAMRDHASGFCIYNDVSAGIAFALENGAERVAYIDVDVHHGDGVERAFWDDPRVLTISLHESPRVLFPGTGWAYDVGGKSAEGYAVNVPLPPGTSDEDWLRAFDAVVPPLIGAFQPELIVSQHGCDSHYLDPLAHFVLSLDGQRRAYELIHELAHQHAAGRWVATGGGGYEIVGVVPRAWSHLLAEMLGRP